MLKEKYILKINENGEREVKEFIFSVEKDNADEAIYEALEQAKMWLGVEWYNRTCRIAKNDFIKQIESIENHNYCVLSNHKYFNQIVTLKKIVNENRKEVV